MNARIVALGLLVLSPLLSACAGDRETLVAGADVDTAAARQTDTAPMAPESTALPPAIVHKSPTCGCCELWVEHLREAGFTVEVRNHAPDALNRLKGEVGVPYGKGSCHTARIGDYFVEGHVPAADIKRLLAEAPQVNGRAAKGLALPGMPLGSPGMEVPDGTVQPYTVELVGEGGGTVPFASH
ncbi:DUF411 domain-containing protein [Marilutibacter maris]|uniref:Copper amine oxidase n=1 Tax=Marilutibacter maris TaxID=1605891 RepID=A0A2U9TGJ4_9GAMM|nr:DUF411 domain-containing protein [Lysobacter maris]AWV07290.1 copper amine oxidase [Lysobacter maris]KAB8181829.1 DUF411 domain-containing protein [Lysobacter maris]